MGKISPSQTPASGSGGRRPRGLVFCDGNRGPAGIRYAVAVEDPAFAAAAQAIGLAIHELATNAGKYGALSVDAGRVDVGWRLDGDIFAMSWVESKGPPVLQPKRRGVGSTVVDPLVRQTNNGEVHPDFLSSGVWLDFTLPAADAVHRDALFHESVASSRTAPAP